MWIDPNFGDLLELFNRHAVEYLVVGAYALAIHGAPRATKDLDLFVAANPQNAKRILRALEEFGFGEAGLCESDFSSPGNTIQLGYPPVRVDLLTQLSGVRFEDAWPEHVDADLGGLHVPVIGREHYLHNKRATGRLADLADIERLEAEQ